MTEDGTHHSDKSAPSPAVELMWSEVIENGTHQYTWKAGKQVPNDMWSGKQVAAEPPPVSSNGKQQFNAGVALGWIGAVTLIAGVITLIASFNVTPVAPRGYSPTLEAIQSATHTALVAMVCGSLLTLIGSIAVIALLAVKAHAKS